MNNTAASDFLNCSIGKYSQNAFLIPKILQIYKHLILLKYNNILIK